jgi:hypothetical protein
MLSFFLSFRIFGVVELVIAGIFFKVSNYSNFCMSFFKLGAFKSFANFYKWSHIKLYGSQGVFRPRICLHNHTFNSNWLGTFPYDKKKYNLEKNVKCFLRNWPIVGIFRGTEGKPTVSIKMFS